MMQNPAKFRNISLITAKDPQYRQFVEDIKLSRARLSDIRGKRDSSDLLAEVLEEVIRKWVEPVGGKNERILSFEKHVYNQKYHKSFKEIDFMIHHGEHLHIGEVKVSSSTKHISRAYRQLSESIDILHHTGKQVKPVIIYVNLSFEQAYTKIETFDPDYRKMTFMSRSVNGQRYDLLQISPVDIFNWALQKGFIRNPELLQQAMDESKERYLLRVERQKLYPKGSSEYEWPIALQQHDHDQVEKKKPRFEAPTPLKVHLKKALDNKRYQWTKLGIIILFDPAQSNGEIKASSGKISFHISNFSKPMSYLPQKGDVVIFKRKIKTDDGYFKASGCKLINEATDFPVLISIIWSEIPAFATMEYLIKAMTKESEYLTIIKQGTRQIFASRTDQFFIDTITHYYDKELKDIDFIPFCMYLEQIAFDIIPTADREMLEQTLYCHFMSKIRPGILFQTWKHKAFRYLAYTDGVDYQIAQEIIYHYRDQLDDSHWNRLKNYS